MHGARCLAMNFGSEERHVAVVAGVHAVGALTQIKSLVVPTVSEEGFEEFFGRSYRRVPRPCCS